MEVLLILAGVAISIYIYQDYQANYNEFTSAESLSLILLAAFGSILIIVPLILIIHRTVETMHKMQTYTRSITTNLRHIYIGEIAANFKLIKTAYFLLFPMLVFIFLVNSSIYGLQAPTVLLLTIFFACLYIAKRPVYWGVYIFSAIAIIIVLDAFSFWHTEIFTLMAIICAIVALGFCGLAFIYHKTGCEILHANHGNLFKIEAAYRSQHKQQSLTSRFFFAFVSAHNRKAAWLWYFIAMGTLVFSLLLAAIATIYGLLLAGYSFYAITKARQYHQPDALDVIKYEQRVPILLLRSFNDDGNRTDLQATIFEDVIISITSKIGPTICIGDPREKVPTTGAFRTYIREDNDESWQTVVQTWMEQSQLVMLVAGATPFLGWELDQLNTKQCLAKTVILMPPEILEKRGERWKTFLNYLTPLYPDIAIHSTPFESLLAIVHDQQGVPTFIHSNTDSAVDYKQAIKIAIGLQKLTKPVP
ncbi:hypothetical protein [Paraglaciecola aestuariivivens]